MSTANTTTDVAALAEAIKQKEAELRLAKREFQMKTYVKRDHEAEEAMRKAARKAKYQTKNGLTVHGLRQAGNTVRVSHIRYTQLDGVAVLVPVPSYMRKVANFTPNGGTTHIVIETPTGELVAVASVCHVDDSFDYKMGVKLALDSISTDDVELLMSGNGLAELAEKVA